MIQCPYCLEDHKTELGNKGYTCTGCKSKIPRDFIEKNIPRASVGLVGFTGHGKTVYLTSLFYLLKSLQRKGLWEGFGWLSQDDHTLNIMHKHVPLFENSELPPGTPENFPKPALIQFLDFPSVGDSFLSFYDTAGRVYEETEKITDMGRFVAYSKVVIFVISINDCGSRWIEEMERLLNTYINGAYDKLHANLKDQHMIVALSKADSLNGLPTHLRDFLQEGSYEWWNLSGDKNSFKDKIRALKWASDEVKKWLEDNDCGAFTNLARRYFKSVEYSIVSSTGSAPIGNRLSSKLTPRDPKRVLDPFIWVIEKTRPKSFLKRVFG